MNKAPFLNFKQPKLGIIAHRGTPSTKPENTLLSFEAAALDGASCIEFDVKLSKDGEMVIFHDDDLNRTTNGQGPLCDYTLKQLKQLDAGMGESIPTFEEVFELANRLNLQMNIEIKDEGQNGITIAKMIAMWIENKWQPHMNPPLVSSFVHENLYEFRKHCPKIAIGYLIDRPSQTDIETVKQLGNATLNFEDPKLPIEELMPFIKQPFNVLIYTVNDKARVKELIDAGVFAVFTDKPGVMLRP